MMRSANHAAGLRGTRQLAIASCGRIVPCTRWQHTGPSQSQARPTTAVCLPNAAESASVEPNPAQPAPAAAPAVLDVLRNTSPIDRTRNQARLIFSKFDADADGLLTQEQLINFFQYCSSKCSHSLATVQLLDSQKDRILAELAPGKPVHLERFVQLFRDQLELIGQSSYIDGLFIGPKLNEVVLKSNLAKPELSQVHWRFVLLDFNGDGQLSIDELQQVPGIEAAIAADKLDDADEDEDGLVNFQQYLTTYAKPRRVYLTMLVMAVNAAIIWLLFNSPLDMMIKSVAAIVLVMQPQIVNRPIIKIYEIVETIMNRGKAEVALRAA